MSAQRDLVRIAAAIILVSTLLGASWLRPGLPILQEQADAMWGPLAVPLRFWFSAGVHAAGLLTAAPCLLAMPQVLSASTRSWLVIAAAFVLTATAGLTITSGFSMGWSLYGPHSGAIK
jgi:hypothetical protein